MIYRYGNMYILLHKKMYYYCLLYYYDPEMKEAAKYAYMEELWRIANSRAYLVKSWII